MFVDVPDWAARHQFWNHSNPKSKDRAKDFFEKSHVRPALNSAYQSLKTGTESERDAALDTISKYKDDRGSAAMAGGNATQLATDLHLVPHKDTGETVELEQAIELAVDSYRKYSPVKHDLDTDSAKKDKYLEELPQVIRHAVLGLKEAMAQDNRILGEVEYCDLLPGLAVPHKTLPDYGRRGDLKTKWSKKTATKKGWSDNGVPKSLGGMFDMKNVYQVAGWWALNGNQPPFLVYANHSNYQVFTPDNAPELRDDFLADVVEDIKLYHKTTENLLRAASNKSELLSLVSPDWRALHWNEPPAYLEEAHKLWGFK
jgi:hypothetical protein